MEKLLEFIELTRKFRAVKRRVIFAEDKQQENDIEHSFQLALTAWYLINTDKIKLDVEKALKYALAHDLVEVYAGDTPSAVHRSYEAERHTKKAREEEALKRIKKEFPEFKELHKIIHAYEKREDKESRFVYALDKVMPILNIYLDKGYSWKVNDVKVKDVIAYKKDQIAESPEVKKYFDQLVPLIRKLEL
ncbi:HD domain-containing protein [Candidatus Parcubacteria bacterium]|nr:HD domain-containing protein [Candidatus Parcubacteria bacterium]